MNQSLPVVKVDGLEGVDTLGTPIRHPGQATKEGSQEEKEKSQSGG